MDFSISSPRLSLATALIFAVFLFPSVGKAEDWKRVSSKDGKISALFPVDIGENPQAQVDKTRAGDVKSIFGEYHGDGIILAGSGADLPRLAKLASEKTILETSKKTFLEQAKGTEISFKATTVGGASARELIYKGAGYQGKGKPYNGRAIFLIVSKRIYIINSVISDPNAKNKASEKKLLESIKVAK